MPLIKNNLYYELTTETQTKPVSAVKIQMDVLDGCHHKCPGCFVHRRGNASSIDQLAHAKKFVKSITDQGILVDEILIGPTDFLASENFYEVMPELEDMINDNSPILAFVSTLIDGDIVQFCDWITERINLDTEIEIGIATNPHKFSEKNYLQNIKDKLYYIDKNLEHEVTYTFVVNIRDYGLDYTALHDKTVKEFSTILDFIPSVSRSHKPNIILNTLTKFNEYFNDISKDTKLNNIMVDHSHAGMNYTVLNYKRGDWFLSPFMYENMAIYDDSLKVQSFDDVVPITETQINKAKGTECEHCPLFFSCYNRKIILLRDYLGVKHCIAPKENMLNNIHNYNAPAQTMYKWDGYSVENDKKGYRKKFLVTKDNDPELERIKSISYVK
tara:strand:- start:10223 stop:11380 length:1158 start_codon:yes stop_codon:yes gene_type:complete